MATALEHMLSAFALLRFFPASDAMARRELARQVCGFAATARQVEWLTNIVMSHYNDWPGISELRGIFCTRFRPADGIETSLCGSSTYGAVLEARGTATHEHYKAIEAGLPSQTRMIEGAVERMPEQELARFHDSILSPLASRSMPGTTSDRASIRAAEAEIARCRPTLTHSEKQRRTAEIERALGRGVGSPEPSYSTSNVRR